LVEAALAGVFALFFVITLLWPDWIELIFGIDPDRGNGEAEWSIVAVFGLLAGLCSLLARMEWRRARALGRERVNE
jgi:hypothetical protein